MQTARTVQVDGFDYEIDSYSVEGGLPTQDFHRSGGSVVLHGRVDDTVVTVTVSAAELERALGRALVVLLDEDPAAATSHVSVTGYIDSETSGYAELARTEQ
jgi:hypothetical protein